MWRLFGLLITSAASVANSESSVNLGFPIANDDIYDQPTQLMGAGSPKTAHVKDEMDLREHKFNPDFDFSKFDEYINRHASDADHNRIKRRAKRRRGNRRRTRMRSSTTRQPEDQEVQKLKNQSVPEPPLGMISGARRADDWASQQSTKSKKKNKLKSKSQYDYYEPPIKEWESGFVEMPKDLYQAHLRPGVIFRIHMSEAIMKMQYRTYGEDKDESVIEADVEYLRLTRKVINDEITKFEDLKWLVGWFNNRSDLIQEHMCNTRYFAVGTPATMFTHTEEYMKRMCLFDNVYIDHIPYVVGEDGSLMAAVAPPVLHCDAATCTSVPFIDSVMFDERLGRTNVRTLTRCQASCRAHCRNDPDCLKRCSDRCFSND